MRARLESERGTTLVEVMIATATGMVVFAALTTLIVVTMHSSARVSARVHATQEARIALTRVIDQLHSACVTPGVSPVKEGSTGTLLRFVHQTGSGAVLTPVLSEISLSGDTLTQSDYLATGGTAPSWSFALKPSSTRQLATGIGPIPPSSSIFTYQAYAKKSVSETLPAPLSGANALRTVQVDIAFSAAPGSTSVADAGASAQIRDTALLRLTTLAFGKETDGPCL